MTPDQFKEDAEYAHAVFDLCGIKKLTHGNAAASLRIRASILAEMAGVLLTQPMIDEQKAKRKQDSN